MIDELWEAHSTWRVCSFRLPSLVGELFLMLIVCSRLGNCDCSSRFYLHMLLWRETLPTTIQISDQTSLLNFWPLRSFRILFTPWERYGPAPSPWHLAFQLSRWNWDCRKSASVGLIGVSVIPMTFGFKASHWGVWFIPYITLCASVVATVTDGIYRLVLLLYIMMLVLVVEVVWFLPLVLIRNKFLPRSGLLHYTYTPLSFHWFRRNALQFLLLWKSRLVRLTYL